MYMYKSFTALCDKMRKRLALNNLLTLQLGFASLLAGEEPGIE